MALIACSECGKEVSSRAVACIHCGNPLVAVAVPAAAAGAPPAVQTIEETGKVWKAQQLWATGLACLGIVTVFSEHPGLGGFMVFAGFVWFIGARVGAWWNHG